LALKINSKLVQVLPNRNQKLEIKSPYTTQNTYSNWGTIEHGIPQGSNFGTLLFIIYINDLQPTINTLAAPIIFADDMSVIISINNLHDFFMLSNKVVSLMCKWFAMNKLTLNLDKNNIITFITYTSPQFPISIGCEDKYIEESVHTKFLGLQIDNHLNWKTHIDQLVQKLSRACYLVRSLSQVSNIDNLKLIYFAYFHSLMKCGIIFWGNSSDNKIVFTLQKKIVKIIVGTKPQTPCSDLFKKLQILSLPCEYIFSVLNNIINNLEHFQTNSALHCIKT
jgi:hypothetical protein